MKVAIASSGLGHVRRGVETWALDTAEALYQEGVDVTLFAGAPLSQPHIATHHLAGCKRNDRLTQFVTRRAPRWTWRWHLKSAYEIEQLFFWQRLHRHLRRHHFDILHVQDPLIAALAQRAFLRQSITCRCILAHGTEEPAHFLQSIRYVQHLAPWHLQHTLETIGVTPDASEYRDWVVLPNFVDTNKFLPISTRANQMSLRRRFHLPESSIIWGTTAAIKKTHKRIDWLIDAFAHAAAVCPHLHLIIAGSRQADTDELQRKAQRICPQRVSFFVDLPHSQIPELLQTLDAFVLSSLFEMMPIALLEALSCGLPVYTHQHPVLAWMAGPGGKQLDLREPGELQGAMQHSDRTDLQIRGAKSREHAMKMFSSDVVIPAYIRYYENICKTGVSPPCRLQQSA